MLAPLLAAALLAAGASAQTLFEETRGRHIEAAPIATYAMAIGDVDGDGMPDLVVADRFENRILRNVGGAVFVDATPGRWSPISADSETVLLFDMDGDADLDIYTGRRLQDELYRNDGSGRFTRVTPTCVPPEQNRCSAAAAGDFDGDGDLDLLIGEMVGYPVGLVDRLLLNDGTGRFVEASGQVPQVLTGPGRFAVHDFDGDGDLDVAVADQVGDNRMYWNDGTGRFTGEILVGGPAATFDVVAADFDIDGRTDLLFVNYQDISRLLRNTPTGFVDATGAWIPPGLNPEVISGAAIDVDQDGDLDVVLAGVDHWRPENELLINDRTRRFLRDRLPTVDGYTVQVHAAHLDGDAFDDLLIVQGGNMHSHVLLGDGTGGFANGSAVPIVQYPAPATAAAHGDVDGDGDRDLFLASDTTDGYVFLNNGRGRFVERVPVRTSLSSVRGYVQAAALFDSDGDQDLDLALATDQSLVLLLTNDGSGQFTDVTVSHMPRQVAVLASNIIAADFENDRDIDLFIASRTLFRTPSALLRNDGNGVFYNVGGALLPATPHPDATAAACGDIDGDGDLDLVLGTGTRAAIWQNDGTGRFLDATPSLPALAPYPTAQVSLGDLDSDGDLDLVAAHGAFPYWVGTNRMYLNDGAGRFAEAPHARFPAVAEAPGGLALADLDLDGDLDVTFNVVGLAPQRTHYVLRNDGRANFTDISAAQPPHRQPQNYQLFAADFDDDGDPDLLSWFNGADLQRNLMREINVPHLPRLGGRFDIELWNRPPSAHQARFMQLAFATREVVYKWSFPPFGRLGLDPTVTITGVVVPVPPGAVGTSLSLSVPNDPSLAGVSIFAQALAIAGTPYGHHLTRHVEIRFAR